MFLFPRQPQTKLSRPPKFASSRALLVENDYCCKNIPYFPHMSLLCMNSSSSQQGEKITDQPLPSLVTEDENAKDSISSWTYRRIKRFRIQVFGNQSVDSVDGRFFALRNNHIEMSLQLIAWLTET